MNILKHMEAVFLAAALVALPASYLGGGHPDAQDRATTSAAAGARHHADAVATPGKMAVVVVSAKRLDAGQKREIVLAAR